MSAMTYEDIAAFLGASTGSVPPIGTQIQQFISDSGAVIAEGWTSIKTGANGIVNSVRTIAAEGASTGTALLTMDVGAAGAAIAPLLGVAAGVGLYSVAPNFWDSVAEKLMAAGSTIGGKVYAFLDQAGNVVFDEKTIGAFQSAFADLGVFSPKAVPAEIGQAYINESVIWGFANMASVVYPEARAAIPITETSDARRDALYRLFEGENTDPGFLSIQGVIDYCVERGLVTDSTIGILNIRCYYENGYVFDFAIINPSNDYSITINRLTPNLSITVSGLRTSYLYSRFVGTGSEANGGFNDITNDGTYQFDNYNTGEAAAALGTCCITNLDGVQQYIDPDAILAGAYDTISDFMDSLGQEGQSLPGVGEGDAVGYPLNPTQAPTQTGVLDPTIDWGKLWDYLFNPAGSIAGNPAIDGAIDGTIEGDDDISIPRDDAIEADPPVQPDPDIPVPPIITPELPTTVGSGKLFEVYSVSTNDLNTLGGYLWSADILTQLQKIWTNPLEGVIGLFRVWATPTTAAARQVRLGAVAIPGLSCPVVSNQFKRINLGSVDVRELNKNVGDYTPYTQVSLYLPFIGIVELDTDEVMAGSVNVQYVVDFWTGTCIAEVRLTKSGSTDNAMLYVYNGNLAQQIPLTSVSFNGLFGALLAAGSAIGSIGTGGALVPLMVAGAGVVTHDMAHVHRAGLISSNSGIMTSKKPMIILGRRNVANATGYSNYTGFPANKTKTLGNCHGFTRVKAINLKVVATNAEKQEIEQLLKEGVIFAD